MVSEIAVTPSGRLVLNGRESGDDRGPGLLPSNVADAFSVHQSSGLFALAAAKSDTAVGASITYWRDFSRLYLTELCRRPELLANELSIIEHPSQPELEAILSKAPPMKGAEYLNVDFLASIWAELDEWLRKEVQNSGIQLSDWLKKYAPMWHQVGRVCFHLAENKQDTEYPFAFLATYAPGFSRAGQLQYQPLSGAIKEYAGEGNKKALINLLSPVHLASKKSSFVKELVDSNDIFHALMWTPGEAFRFLKEVPHFEECGILVRLPDWWRKRSRPRVAVTIGENKRSNLGFDAMLDFQISMMLGNVQLTRSEMNELLSAKQELVYIKGQWVEVDREKLSAAISHWQELERKANSSGVSFIEGMRLLAGASSDLSSNVQENGKENEWSFVNAGSWLSGVLSNLRSPNLILSKPISKNFQGTLRPYQQTGHDWLWFLSRLGLGACLADDMGLGKTVQILSLLLTLKEERNEADADCKTTTSSSVGDAARPSLLVLPASLLSNWKAEIARFAPSLKACFVHPSETDTFADIADGTTKDLSSYDLVVTTYGMLLRLNWLSEIEWQLAILDEAQAIKNPSSRQTQSVKKLKCRSRIALTGTPVENRIGDLWSLFDFISPGLLGSAAKFKSFVKRLEDGAEHRYAPLRNLVSPYILRRLKTDKTIISDLPDKTEIRTYCGLTREQLALYSKSVDELSLALKDSDGIKRRGLVLSFLLKFKQICNHPSQFLGDGEYDPTKSGKFERLKIISEEIASRQEKLLVFSQFREMTSPIASFLAETFGQPGLILHGGTAVSKRKELVDRFQNSDGPPFMVLSLKAGGTGLNLTAASHVAHFDRWWNPSVENQASDRAYRIGQHRNVLVHKFICKGTIEEKIDKLIMEKTELSDSILGGGAETVLTEMSDAELLDIVSLDLDKVTLD